MSPLVPRSQLPAEDEQELWVRWPDAWRSASIHAPAGGGATSGLERSKSDTVQNAEPGNSAPHFWLAPTSPPRLPVNVAVVKPAKLGVSLRKARPPSR